MLGYQQGHVRWCFEAYELGDHRCTGPYDGRES